MKLRFIIKSLVENFPQTYITGGTVRDWLTLKTTNDFDIATHARPEQIINFLSKNKIKFDQSNLQFGVISIIDSKQNIAITTFRTETYKQGSRFPKIRHCDSPKTDSLRRDFTVNALYFQPNANLLLDFHNGLDDIKNKTIRFIGIPEKRISEDPLRVIRAWRFAVDHGFKIEPISLAAINKNSWRINQLSETKIEAEISKISNFKKKLKLRKIINNQLLTLS